MSLSAEQVSYSAAGQDLLRGVSLNLQPGRVQAILGPNGAGKSTLIRLLAGELQPRTGQVTLDDRRLANWNSVELARRRAVLPQSETLRFAFTVEQVVCLGRLPWEPEQDSIRRALIQEALTQTGTAYLHARSYPTLSGGERQRVQLARVLAQLHARDANTPRYLLLDEPTASLDLRYQHEVLALVRRLAQNSVGVAVVLHDPNLAMRYADEISLLCCGELLAQGPTEAVLTSAHLQQVYGIDVEWVETNSGRQLVVR